MAHHRPRRGPLTAAAGANCLVGGRPATFREAGEGRPLLLVHGAGGRGDLWAPQLDELADAARLLAVDLSGHGGSGGPGLRAIAAYADWVTAFLDTLGLDRVVL